MHKTFAGLIVLLATLLASAPAHGTASATIIVNGSPHVLTQTGFIGEQVSAVGVQLQPGQSTDISLTYSIAVSDQGQPAAFDPSSVGCIAIFPTPCNPTYTGFEVAKVELRAFFTDPRSTALHAIEITGDDNTITLQTHGDSFAESLSLSGSIHWHLLNTDPVSAFAGVFPTFVGLWVLADPIPEPAVYVQLLAGLGVLAAAIRGGDTRRC